MNQGPAPEDQPPRILVVEDQPGLRAVLRFNLREEGIKVIEAARGDEACALLRGDSRGGRHPDFDLVITDLHLPGADGMAVLRQARALDPPIPVVVLTAFGTREHARECLKLGAADYLTKPFRRAELKARIFRVLRREEQNRARRSPI